jgi:hypothetical protein
VNDEAVDWMPQDRGRLAIEVNNVQGALRRGRRRRVPAIEPHIVSRVIAKLKDDNIGVLDRDRYPHSLANIAAKSIDTQRRPGRSRHSRAGCSRKTLNGIAEREEMNHARRSMCVTI